MMKFVLVSCLFLLGLNIAFAKIEKGITKKSDGGVCHVIGDVTHEKCKRCTCVTDGKKGGKKICGEQMSEYKRGCRSCTCYWYGVSDCRPINKYCSDYKLLQAEQLIDEMSRQSLIELRTSLEERLESTMWIPEAKHLAPMLNDRKMKELKGVLGREFMELWEFDTKTNKERGYDDSKVGNADNVMTIVTGVSLNTMMDIGSPLFDARNDEIRTRILKNAFDSDRIDPNDPLMETAEGLKITNGLTAEVMVFKKVDGKITVNGVPLLGAPRVSTDHLFGNRSTVVYTLEQNLFNHNQMMETAYDNVRFYMSDDGGPFSDIKSGADNKLAAYSHAKLQDGEDFSKDEEDCS